MARFDELYKMINEADGDIDAIIGDMNAALDKYNESFQKEKDAQEIADKLNAFGTTYYSDIPGEFTAENIIEVFDFGEKARKVVEKLEKSGKTLEDMIAEKGW